MLVGQGCCVCCYGYDQDWKMGQGVGGYKLVFVIDGIDEFVGVVVEVEDLLLFE